MSSREEFEAWATNEWKFPFVVERSGDSYKFLSAQNKWEVWQAATKAMEAKCAALAADNEKAMEAMRQADEVVKRAHSKFAALADENMALRSAINNGMTAPETPATDAYLAEVRSQGAEMYVRKLEDCAEDAELGGFDVAAQQLRSEALAVREFAAQLRQGGAAK